MRFASIALASITLASVAFLDVASAQQAAPTFPTPVAATGSPWDGLNLLLTRQRLLDLQTAVNAGDPVATQACTNAISDANGYLGQTPNPIQGVFSVPSYYGSQQAVQQQITAQIRGDGCAALSLAWGYALTGQQSFADASKQFIWAWVNNLTHAPGRRRRQRPDVRDRLAHRRDRRRHGARHSLQLSLVHLRLRHPQRLRSDLPGRAEPIQALARSLHHVSTERGGVRQQPPELAGPLHGRRGARDLRSEPHEHGRRLLPRRACTTSRSRSTEPCGASWRAARRRRLTPSWRSRPWSSSS